MENKLSWFRLEMSKEPIELVAKYGPILTPLAPASTAVAGMAHGLFDSMSYFGIIPALGSGLGMEATGFLSGHLLIRSVRRQEPLSFFFSLAFLAAYAVFAWYAMDEIPNAGIFQAFVLMSIVTYLAAGLYTYNDYADKARDEEFRREAQARADEREIKRQQEQDDFERKRRELELWKQAQEIEQVRQAQALEIERQRTAQMQAEARRAKAEHGPKVSPVEPKVSESFGSWRNVPQAEREKIKTMNTAQIMEAYNVSERTAQNWQKYGKAAQ